jgi:hypothetical protein
VLCDRFSSPRKAARSPGIVAYREPLLLSSWDVGSNILIPLFMRSPQRCRARRGTAVRAAPKTQGNTPHQKGAWSSLIFSCRVLSRT